ncbi:MAG: DUF4157 domain-containing protein [Bacteroidetes bacterium]|nr:DUF4157 domain-containing protein [Bacteroidota bacterium]
MQRLARTAAGLSVNPTNDSYEHEAERTASHVMNGGLGSNAQLAQAPAGIQRSPAAEAGGGGSASAGPAGLASTGRPLDATSRTFMEPRFGTSFEGVRIHTGPDAAASAAELGASAYTVGRDIVFGAGMFRPETHDGQHLLAHELAHVVQQRPGISRQPAPPATQTQTPPAAAPQTPATGTQPTPQQGGAATTAPALTDAERVDILARANAAALTIVYMKGKATAQQQNPTGMMQFKPTMVQEADHAIHQQFGTILPKRRSYAAAFAAPDDKTTAVRAMTPDKLAALRIPDDATARHRMGEVMMSLVPEAMDQAGITDPDDTLLQTRFVRPIYASLGIGFVRDYEKAVIGGNTEFGDPDAANTSISVTLPTEQRNIGHIVVHEAMHYYVHDAFRIAARGRSDHRELMEGGAEYFARIVIANQLASKPEFAINYSTYSGRVSYINAIGAPRLTTFPAMYFQGRVDLLNQIGQP